MRRKLSSEKNIFRNDYKEVENTTLLNQMDAGNK